VITHPLPALALSDGSEDVKAALEPVIKAVCDLDGLMFGVIGGINTIHDRLRAIDREVAMEFDHGVSGIDQVGSVHLNFIVILSLGGTCSQNNRQQDKREPRSVHKIIPYRWHAKFVTHRWPNRLTTSHEEDYQLDNEFIVAKK
jgi:hypothetical protein